MYIHFGTYSWLKTCFFCVRDCPCLCLEYELFIFWCVLKGYLAKLTIFCTLWSSSTVAGLVSTLLTAPVDMIKTRLMLQQESERVGSYRNGFHCAYEVMKSNPILSTAQLLLIFESHSFVPVTEFHTLNKLVVKKLSDASIDSVDHLEPHSPKIKNLIMSLCCVVTGLVYRRPKRSLQGVSFFSGPGYCPCILVPCNLKIVFFFRSLAMFARLGPQTTITFVVCEQLRELVGMKAI